MQGDINRKAPLFIRIVGFVFLFSIGFFVKSYFVEEREKNNEEVVKQKLDSLNKTLPFVYEDFLSFDSVSLLKERELRYNITIIKVDSTDSKLYIDALKYKMKKQAQTYYETNEGMKPFWDNNFIIDYFYYDKNGKYLFDYAIKSNKK